MKNESLVAFLIIVIAGFVIMAVLSYLPWESPIERSLLDADEIPGDWKLDPGRSDNVSRFFYVGQLPDAILAAMQLTLFQYENSTAAHQEFVVKESELSSIISHKPELGDECFMTSKTSSRDPSKEHRLIYFRVGNILIHNQIVFYQEYPLTDEWIFDLIQLQIDKIQRSMSIENTLIPLPYHSPA